VLISSKQPSNKLGPTYIKGTKGLIYRVQFLGCFHCNCPYKRRLYEVSRTVLISVPLHRTLRVEQPKQGKKFGLKILQYITEGSKISVNSTSNFGLQNIRSTESVKTTHLNRLVIAYVFLII
jgi:hypothetical protein